MNKYSNKYVKYYFEYLTIVTYDSAKPCIITLRESLKPQSRAFKKSSQHDPRNNEFREIATTCNTKNITKYRASIEYTAKLTDADVEIRNTNLRKDSVNNTIEQSIQHEKLMLNYNLRVFDGLDNSKSKFEVRELATLTFSSTDATT
jgi:hypothetical protein